jgi:hypothetical protein
MKPLWFRIQLIDCNGQLLAQWTYDEVYPVIAPQFTYDNQDERYPYRIRFTHLTETEKILPIGDLNQAIYIAVQQFASDIKRKS